MSAYGKPQPPQLHGYETSRTYTDNAFPYSSQSYGTQSSIPTSTPTPGFQTPGQMTPLAYPSSNTRPTYDDQAGPYLNVGSSPIPEITSFTPSRGPAGTTVCVYFTTMYEILTSNTPTFFLGFGQQKCPASIRKVGPSGGVCQYTLACEVPQFAGTNWSSSRVPVFMFMEGDGDVISKVEVGDFTYENSSQPLEGTRKRKVSTDSTDLMRSPPKRNSQQLKPKEEFSPYGFNPADSPSSYSPYLQATSNYNSLMPQYSRTSGSYPPQAAPRNIAYGYANSSTASPPNLKPSSPHTSTWNPAYSISSSIARSPGLPSNASMHRPALTSLPSPAGNPTFTRTSTLQSQSSSPATTPHGGHTYNPYPMYANKAKLDIDGDLSSMMIQNWTPEEWEAKRRLVQFKRSQSGCTITTTFHPITAEERPSHSTVISCIYWEEKNDCYVTSVDTIYLLEQLVAARFTVEEKNRIRRNLEGFRPATVSKGKPDSEEFFKVIMAFPNPKPRNIEKDVKVFHWKDLGPALKKIISKYSASPSSTLPPAHPPALLTPVSSTGYATENSSAPMSYSGDHHGGISPRSISGSTTSAYTSNLPPRTISPQSQKSLMLQSGPPDLRISVPHGGPETTSHWQGGSHHMPTPQHYQHQLGTQSARSSWDLSNYLENSPATAAGTSAPQTIDYPQHHHQPPRSVVDASLAVSGGDDNRIGRGLPSHHQQHSQQIPRT